MSQPVYDADDAAAPDGITSLPKINSEASIAPSTAQLTVKSSVVLYNDLVAESSTPELTALAGTFSEQDFDFDG